MLVSRNEASGRGAGRSNPSLPDAEMFAEGLGIRADFPWVREVWLLSAPTAPGAGPAEADLLVVCDCPPRWVGPGRRKRLLGQIEVGSDVRLDLRLTTAAQLSKWLAARGRFAAAFRDAVRLYPQEEE